MKKFVFALVLVLTLAGTSAAEDRVEMTDAQLDEISGAGVLDGLPVAGLSTGSLPLGTVAGLTNAVPGAGIVSGALPVGTLVGLTSALPTGAAGGLPLPGL